MVNGGEDGLACESPDVLTVSDGRGPLGPVVSAAEHAANDTSDGVYQSVPFLLLLPSARHLAGLMKHQVPITSGTPAVVEEVPGRVLRLLPNRQWHFRPRRSESLLSISYINSASGGGLEHGLRGR